MNLGTPSKAKVTPEEPKPNSSVRKLVFREAQVESKKTQRPGHTGHITRKHRKTFPKPRKINPYVLPDQELKIEENKQAQRTIFNWKRRQQNNALRGILKVLNVSELLQKKFPKKFKNKKRIINMRRQSTDKVTKKPIARF